MDEEIEISPSELKDGIRVLEAELRVMGEGASAPGVRKTLELLRFILSARTEH